MDGESNNSLEYHVQEVVEGKRRFETAEQSIYRMITGFEGSRKPIYVNGSEVTDYQFFRQGPKKVVGWYDEIKKFVNFIGAAAEGKEEKSMWFGFIGDPGNGKTFVTDFTMGGYRPFLMQEANRRYTFKFKDLNELEKIGARYGAIKTVESQTFEDPMILAMNLHDGSEAEKQKFFSDYFDVEPEMTRKIFNVRRMNNELIFLGADSDYILNQIRDYSKGDFDKMLQMIETVPVRVTPSQGRLTTRTQPTDKNSATVHDFIGDLDMGRMMMLDTDNPHRFNLREGSIPRSGGGGIHVSDEIFDNNHEVLKAQLDIIQYKQISHAGFRWPVDTLMLGTSNIDMMQQYVDQYSRKSPLIDRGIFVHVGHNTNYKQQSFLTRYALQDADKEEALYAAEDRTHEDPNLEYALNVAIVLTRLPSHPKLTSVEMMKLAADEIAEDKGRHTLKEVVEELMKKPVLERFGMTGLGQRDLKRAASLIDNLEETRKGHCKFAGDAFRQLEQIVYDSGEDEDVKNKYLKAFKIARGLYRERLEMEMYNAFQDNSDAIRQDVQKYINQVLALENDDETIPDNLTTRWTNPGTGKVEPLSIDPKYILAVEDQMELTSKEAKKSHRTTIREIAGRKKDEPDYDWMDQEKLVQAVARVVTQSNIHGEGSLEGMLANPSNSKNKQRKSEMMRSMIDNQDYCESCAQRTIKEYIAPEKQ